MKHADERWTSERHVSINSAEYSRNYERASTRVYPTTIIQLFKSPNALDEHVRVSHHRLTIYAHANTPAASPTPRRIAFANDDDKTTCFNMFTGACACCACTLPQTSHISMHANMIRAFISPTLHHRYISVALSVSLAHALLALKILISAPFNTSPRLAWLDRGKWVRLDPKVLTISEKRLVCSLARSAPIFIYGV